MELTRRRLLGGAAAAAAAAALPDGAEAAAPKRRRRPAAPAAPAPRVVDVAIVGGGYAGLAAARELTRRGRSVAVLEARDRVGGRVHTLPLDGGGWLDVGGQWVGPTQDRMLELGRDLGVPTFKTYNTGDNVYLRSHTKQRYATSGPLGPIPPEAPSGAAEAGAAIVALNDMARTVPRDAPWKAPNAREWDGQTFETWKLANTASEGGRFLLDVAIEAVFAAEPRDVSLLYVLFYIAAAGNESTPGDFNRLLNTAGGGQEERFVGGAQEVAKRIARALGDRVVLNAPVRRIVHGADRVTVHADGATVIAHRAIVAMSPSMSAKIEHDPPLPGMREQLTQRFPMGTVIKCHAMYDRPFWRDEGLTGQAVGDVDPVRVTYDNSPPDGSRGILLGFIEGEEARTWIDRPAAARRAAVLESFAQYFGDAARNPVDYHERNWANEVWTRGCYEGYAPPGVLSSYGEHLRKPVGRVHWAGTETATIWTGYMEGAVRSGESAAGEVLATLPSGLPRVAVPRRRRRRRRRRRTRRPAARRATA